MRLYELADKWNAVSDRLLDSIDDDDGTVSPDVAAELTQVESDLREKFAACCRMIRNLEAFSEGLENEYRRLRAKADRATKRVDSLKQYVKQCLETVGEKKFVVDEVFTLAIQNNPPSVELLNLDAVPTSYDKPQERQVSITMIRDDLKRGVDVPGVRLVQGTHLRIR